MNVPSNPENRQSTRPVRRALTRRLALAVTAAVSSLALVLSATPAQAALVADYIDDEATSYCLRASGRTTQLMVNAPSLKPMPRTETGEIGGIGQDVGYRPNLQYWDGSAWVTIVYGPYYTGTAGSINTQWHGWAGGLWQSTIWTQRLQPLYNPIYYRVVAQIWWIAGSGYQGAYWYGAVRQHQWFDSVQNNLGVPYCSF